MDAPEPNSRGEAWWAPRFLAGAAALVLGVRGIYLVRFGWDPGWMNLTYLLRAKDFALGRTNLAVEQPLTPLLLCAMRALGLSATGALSALYLLAHLLLLFGILGLAWFLWPGASARRRAAAALTVAVVPLLGSESGRNNLGPLVGAGLATAALALGVGAACARRGVWLRLSLAALVTFLAGTARLESLLTCAAGVAVIAALGRRTLGLARPALTASVLGATCALAGLVDARFQDGGRNDYAFYTFYDGLPFLMFPQLAQSEYQRYRASVGYFGSFASNHGSLLHALLSHPLAAAARIVAKAVDMLGVLLWPQTLTPVGVAAAASGLRAWPRTAAARRAWILLAFAPALAILFVPYSNPAYYLSVAAPLVLVVSRGLDRWTASLSPRTARSVAALGVAILVALIAWVGRWQPSSSRAINQAASYLEERCRAGCLANVLPQALEREAWVELQAGGRIVRGHSRGEESISGDYARAHADDYNFCARVRRAREGGFAGPVLYVDAHIASYRAFDPDFDPEVRYQGKVDLSRAVLDRRFSDGADELLIYHLPEEPRCNDAP